MIVAFLLLGAHADIAQPQPLIAIVRRDAGDIIVDQFKVSIIERNERIYARFESSEVRVTAEGRFWFYADYYYHGQCVTNYYRKTWKNHRLVMEVPLEQRQDPWEALRTKMLLKEYLDEEQKWGRR